MSPRCVAKSREVFVSGRDGGHMLQRLFWAYMCLVQRSCNRSIVFAVCICVVVQKLGADTRLVAGPSFLVFPFWGHSNEEKSVSTAPRSGQQLGFSYGGACARVHVVCGWLLCFLVRQPFLKTNGPISTCRQTCQKAVTFRPVEENYGL